MPYSSSIATTLSPTRETLSSSQLLSSSSSRNASSQITKIYRQASTLFLTRRLPESLSTILPVISLPNEEDTVTQESGDSAPVARASRTTRIKVWSLYLTILNAVLDQNPEEGKQAFGSSEFRALVSKVRDGEVWEEVVRNGYGGREGEVDSDVVINLATLLLAHARTQKINQQRLENYLAASSTPVLDINVRLQAVRDGTRSPKKAGTDTPRDLNARVKILELYTLHVLVRNNEWDYSREFISQSEVLDDERREAFLQALQSLQDEQEEFKAREKEEIRYQEEVRKQEERERRMREEEETQRRERGRQPSEVDYGVEDTYPASTTARSMNGSTKSGPAPSVLPPASRKSLPTPSARPPIKTPASPTLVTRASNIITNLRKLLESMALNFKTNPMALLRLMTFIIALLMVFGRRGVRERVKRMMGQGWLKVRQTAGMGVKVSYI